MEAEQLDLKAGVRAARDEALLWKKKGYMVSDVYLQDLGKGDFKVEQGLAPYKAGLQKKLTALLELDVKESLRLKARAKEEEDELNGTVSGTSPKVGSQSRRESAAPPEHQVEDSHSATSESSTELGSNPTPDLVSTPDSPVDPVDLNLPIKLREKTRTRTIKRPGKYHDYVCYGLNDLTL